jgi:hypothetical protein
MRQGRAMRLTLGLAATAIILSTPAQAYYHYVYYQTRSAPFTPIRAQFNLASLPNSTLNFFVADSGPGVYYPNDSFGSVLGTIKQALAAWNGVTSSSLRAGFGGLESQGQTADTPGVDVIFNDLPGVLGMASPNLPVNPQVVNGPNGPFVAITRSTVILQSNTNNPPGQSYLDSYFTTAVHEFGHAMGLQHTWTGAAMSQAVVRSTTRIDPIEPDDAAALSVLYGNQGWDANLGSISGVVTFNNGAAVNLASVVAISVNGVAVSALTNPDGSYLIQGIPPGSYQLYVHPLPPNAIVSNGEGVLLPSDLTGRSFPASQPFTTVFLSGTQDPNKTPTLQVQAGQTLSNTNFTVQPRSSVAMYDMVTYGYVGPSQTPVTPAYSNVSSGSLAIYAAPNTPPVATPQSVTLLGVSKAYNIQPISAGWYIYFNVPADKQAAGERALVFNTANDMYVLPGGVNFTIKDPPAIASVSPNGDGTVTITGANLGSDSQVYFDGMQAPGANNGSSITVTPPSGNSGQISIITVYNSDGQNSMFVQSSSPQTYTYPSVSAPQLGNVTPQSLAPGISSAIDITAANTNFVQGQVSVGFGTSDINVNGVWVLSPTHLLVNVTAAPSVMAGLSEITVISGLQVISQPFAFQLSPIGPMAAATSQGTIAVAWPATNAVTGGAIYPGSYASIYPAKGTQFPANMQLTLNGSPVAVQYSSQSQVNFLVPPGFPLGPALLTLSSGGNTVSIVVEIDHQ